MHKRRLAPKAKLKKLPKKRAAKNVDAEWEFVEERFGGLGIDFNELARMLPH